MMKQVEKARLFIRRFVHRSDVYGKKWYSSEGEARGYAPQCENFWLDVCLLKNKTGDCSSCEHKVYIPVTTESVLRHITGQEEHHFYQVSPDDGTVIFGALDFDCKPGKEDKGYKFVDVARTSKVLTDWEVPHYIARSTTNGYHLYVFFKNPVPAYKVQALLFEVNEHTGYAEEARLGIRPGPEVFPKQIFVGDNSIGNGIKPPMVEPRFEKGRNCWVNGDDIPIDIDKQWEYFAGMKEATEQMLDEVIAKYEIDVEVYQRGVSNFKRQEDGTYSEVKERHGMPKKLSNAFVEKIIEGCAAINQLTTKFKETNYSPSHQEGFALFHTIYQTRDGEEWFYNNVPGWGKTESDMRQLRHSINKKYKPWTCSRLQMEGICAKGTKCFSSRPPLKTVHGRVVEDPNGKWSDPSPFRYAFGCADDTFIARLRQDVDNLDKDQDKNVLEDQIKAIAERSRIFDKVQRTSLEEYIRSKRLVLVSKVRNIFSNVTDERVKEEKDIIESDPEMVSVSGTTIRKGENGLGFDVVAMNRKGVWVTNPLTPTSLEISEIKTVIHDNGQRETYYKGELYNPVGDGKRVSFEVLSDIWSVPKDLYLYFKSLMSYKLSIDGPKDMEKVSLAAEKFAIEEGTIREVVYHTTQGWIGNAYAMPSIIVDKESIKENDIYKIDLSSKNSVKNVDFAFMSEPDARDLLFHIKTDLMAAFPEDVIYTGLAHTILSAIRVKLGMDKRPTLWFDGGSGAGKTSVTELLQPFFGKPSPLVKWNSSAKYMLEVAYDYNDGMMVVDDFKPTMGAHIVQAARELIQFSYDDGIRGTLTRDSRAREGKPSRALIMASGEGTPDKESSAMARMIVVQTTKKDRSLTLKQYRRCRKRRHEYKAILPHFIKWFLQQDIEKLKSKLDECVEEFISDIQGRANADRIAYNIGANMAAWVFWIDFLKDVQVVAPKEAFLYIDTHKQSLNRVKRQMMDRCSDEQQSNLFLSTLGQLLESDRVTIDRLPGYNLKENVPNIGFYKDKYPDRVYIIPDMAIGAVASALGLHRQYFQTQTIGTQMSDDGCLTDIGPQLNCTRTVRTNKGGVRKVWAVKLSSLGVETKEASSNNLITSQTVPTIGQEDSQGLL